MKAIIYSILSISLLCSCETRCYTCTKEVARTSDEPFPGYPVASVTTFNATKSEAEAFNNSSLTIKKDTINGVVLTTNIKIKCGR